MTTQDWFTGGVALATLLMAGTTVYLGVQTRRAVKAAQKEADATLALVEQARQDRELAVQPVLVLSLEADGDDRGPQVQLRNLGRGPAIRTRVFRWKSGAVHWNGDSFVVAADETYPPLSPKADESYRLLQRQRGATGEHDIPGNDASPNDLWAYCLDQLGNTIQFNLRTGDPPVMSRPADVNRPSWIVVIDGYR